MFAVTMMIISAIVGAGFATGAELIAFFGTSTLPPIIIAAIVGVLLFFIMTVLMYIPQKMNKKIFAPVFFVFFTAMTAGVTELAGPATSAIAVVISILIVWFGFERMLTANKILMIFALIVLLTIAVININGSMPKSNLPANGFTTAGYALLYAGMNCCLLPAIFSEARKTFPRKTMFVSIFAASVTISFFILLMLTAIRINNVGGEVMPIMALSDNLLITLAVFTCILTSMFATLFNLLPSKTVPLNTSVGSKKKLLILCVLGALGYAFSFLGFTKVIGIFYPITGAVMIGFIVFSFCLFLKDYSGYRRTRAR